MDGSARASSTQIDELMKMTIEYENHGPLTWAAPMRLFAEKIADLIGASVGLDAKGFEDRKEFLDSLRDKQAITDRAFGQLNDIRWVCNQILHDTSPTNSEATGKAWLAFNGLKDERIWAGFGSYGSHEPTPEEVAEAIAELVGLGARGVGALFSAVRGEKGKFLKTRALPAGGLALTGLALYQWVESIEIDNVDGDENSPLS